MTGRDWKSVLALTLLAILVQALAMIGVARLRGSVTAFAYQSPDAAEYVSLARGLAWAQRYVPLDASGRELGGPDTWRTPGYPLLLAVVIRMFGESTITLLLFQQILAAASVPLFWLILRHYCSARWAMIAAIAWCCDPFRLYYSLWLMAETFFTLVLLVGIWTWTNATARGWRWDRAALLGALTGFIVLVRPIGIILPALAWIGVLSSSRGHGLPLRGKLVLCCVLGSLCIITPWTMRNHSVAGHWSLSHQSGASFAYHKVVDVVLRSQGRSAYRFDARALAEVRDDIDRRLREKWAADFGPLGTEEDEALTWERLNYGRASGIDPFVASSLLRSVGFDLLMEHKAATVACFFIQGVSMLVFPLGLVIAPPAGLGAAPLSMLGGSRIVAAMIGGGYAILALVVIGRLIRAITRRKEPQHVAAVLQPHRLDTRRLGPAFFVLWPALLLLIMSLPNEDPRFRLPLVPLMWLMAGALKSRQSIPMIEQ